MHELPESREAIHQLKTSNSHFAKLFDEYLEEQKKKRLHLKDQLYTMIREHEASVAG